ncbi:hypothetical protein ILYODFUR_021866 [Ilyodon furcidens]|uniref:MHC class II alpha chain N-terminal domain-containing protein n=1 Tax=Ilyodon furcidens TaxID=33524 RepID=A0ABV0UI51_9TELE
MKLVLFLCSVLWVCADGSSPVLHEDLAMHGCSDSDEEEMYTLEGEEKWYADFKKGEGVYPQPPFIDPIRYQEEVYEQAVVNQQVCRHNLKIWRSGMKDLPDEKGKQQK